MTIQFKQTLAPTKDNSGKPIILSDATFAQRKDKVLQLMRKYDFSSLMIYADKEHGSNFEYLTGFIPRFEEAIQVINQDGTSTLILGNENYNKTSMARTQSEGILCPFFSLPNQPMDFTKTFADYLKDIKVDDSKRIGLVDWKLLSNDMNNFHNHHSVPAFIVDGVHEVFGYDKVVNATQLYMHPKEGARVTNNAEEIARYEYGASLASDAVLEAMNQLTIGQSELEAGNRLNRDGQYPSVVTIAAFGDRFKGANIYPTDNTLDDGDKVALTVAYKGGLSSRSGYAVKDESQLAERDSGYLEEVVYPYFQAYKWWLDNLNIGTKGGDFYQAFSEFYPQTTYGWNLCPGHLVADEEWLSSPFYKDSDATIQSGYIFQLDFIPSQANHNGVSAESTIAVADAALREEIKIKQPELWSRISKRKDYLKEALGLALPEHLLPLASTFAYYRPFLLDKKTAIYFE